MLRVEFITAPEHVIENAINRFLTHCDKEGYVIRNVSYVFNSVIQYYSAFIEYDDMGEIKE